jgi:sugar/nucleoside kinase (ribokinase family)
VVTDVVVRPAAPLRRGTDAPALVLTRRGGSAANVAVQVAAAGGRSRFVGCVGRDGAGDALLADLAGHGVEVCVQRRGRSGAIVVVLEGGERSFLTDRGSVTALDRLPRGALAGVTALHVPAYSLDGEPLATTARRAVTRARAAGALVSVDTSSVAVLERLGAGPLVALRPDVVFADAEEADALGGPPALAAALADGAAVGQARSASPPLLLVKAVVGSGPHRAVSGGDEPATTVWSAGSPTLAVPLARVLGTVGDRTGAGDAFAAGFLIARTGGAAVPAAVAAGHRRAVAHLRSLGAR